MWYDKWYREGKKSENIEYLEIFGGKVLFIIFDRKMKYVLNFIDI